MSLGKDPPSPTKPSGTLRSSGEGLPHAPPLMEAQLTGTREKASSVISPHPHPSALEYPSLVDLQCSIFVCFQWMLKDGTFKNSIFKLIVVLCCLFMHSEGKFICFHTREGKTLFPRTLLCYRGASPNGSQSWEYMTLFKCLVLLSLPELIQTPILYFLLLPMPLLQ